MSNAQGPHPQLLRGLQLKDLGRFADAEIAIRQALAHEPNDAFALHQLAACQFHLPTRHREALVTIDQAIALEPNESQHHALRAYILCVLNRPREALAAARAALELDPTNSSAFTAEAQAHLQMEKWALAETAARNALALDADNSAAANQLAQALRLQNKLAENSAHLAGMLARDPEDAFTHANAGWAALQRGVHREAETHFREALRLDPDFDYAREGLLTSFRARSPLYRGYLRYCFAMARLGKGARWAVILGLYFGNSLARYLPHGIGLAVGAIYFLFVLWVWVAKPFGNFLLLFDSFAKYALRRGEKIEALIVGGSLCAGLLALAASFALRSDDAQILGIGLIAFSFPSSLIFTNASPLGRWVFGTIAVVTVIGTTLTLLAGHVAWVSENLALQTFLIGCIGSVATTWLGNIRALNRR